MTRQLSLIALLLSVASLPAQAEVYCVSTTAQMRTSIINAAVSPEASEIRIRKGFYSLPAADEQSVSLQYSSASDLTMTGGWDGTAGQCTDQQSAPDTTVLSAAGTGRLLSIFLLSGAATRLELRNLSFWQGDIPAGINAAACVNIETDASSDATILVDRNAFRLCNRGSGSGSALSVTARSATVYVRNNLFADNASIAGTALLKGLGSSVMYVSNNTLANNPQLGAGGGPGGLQVTGLATDFYWFSNNVLWNNGSGTGYDLLVSAPAMVLNNNLIGAMAPLPAGVVNNNTLASDPRFVSTGDLRPRADSPLRNAGITPNGGALPIDFDGGSRILGGRIDRGAYEFEELFSNSFE
jgi:hypothetical protein